MPSFFLSELPLLFFHSYLPGLNKHDYETLGSGEYLNDSIVNFYLNWLLENRLDEEHRKDIHIFSSYFYYKLKRYFVHWPESYFGGK